MFQSTHFPGCIKVRTFWDVTSNILIEVHWRMGGIFCFHLQGRWLRQQVGMKRSLLPRYTALLSKDRTLTFEHAERWDKKVIYTLFLCQEFLHIKTLSFVCLLTDPNWQRITARPRNNPSTQHIFLYVKRQLHVSATKCSLNEAVYKQWTKTNEKKIHTWNFYFGILYFRVGSTDVIQRMRILQIQYDKCILKM